MFKTSSPQLNAKILFESPGQRVAFGIQMAWLALYFFNFASLLWAAPFGNLSSVFQCLFLSGVLVWASLDSFRVIARNCTKVETLVATSVKPLVDGVTTYRVSSKPLIEQAPEAPSEMSRAEFLKVFRSAPYSVPSDLWDKLMFFKNILGVLFAIGIVPIAVSLFASGKIFYGVMLVLISVLIGPLSWICLRVQQVIVTEYGLELDASKAETSIFVSLFGFHDVYRTIAVKP
jgi:hypothetical protein